MNKQAFKKLEARVEALERARLQPPTKIIDATNTSPNPALANLSEPIEKLRRWDEENRARLKTFLDDDRDDIQ